MGKIVKLLLIVLMFCPLISNAKSSVWLAEKDNKKIILAGSVHLLHPSQLPLPNEYLQAFNDSQRIVFELDLSELNSLSTAVQIAQQFQLKGTTLDKTLRPDVWQKLQGVMQKYNVPMQFKLFDAAFISFSLPMIIYQQQGYQEGIDKFLYNKAKEEGKEVVGLETFNQQLAALSTLKQIEPNSLIEQMLNDLDDPRFSLGNMIKQVYAGESVAMQEQMQEFKDNPQMNKFYQNLLINRNKAWIPKIVAFADSDKMTMVVVGAMHLIGQDSVLELLKAKDYKVSYYESK